MSSLTTILHIEDNPADQDLATEYARRLPGVFLRSVDSLAQATQELRDYTPDLILLDLCLRDSDGLQSLKILISMKVECRIVVLTDNEDVSSGEMAIAIGARDYVFKSHFSPKILAEMIRGNELRSVFNSPEGNWRAESTRRLLEERLKELRTERETPDTVR